MLLKLGLYQADDPTPAELSADSDDNLFECILSNTPSFTRENKEGAICCRFVCRGAVNMTSNPATPRGFVYRIADLDFRLLESTTSYRTDAAGYGR